MMDVRFRASIWASGVKVEEFECYLNPAKRTIHGFTNCVLPEGKYINVVVLAEWKVSSIQIGKASFRNLGIASDRVIERRHPDVKVHLNVRHNCVIFLREVIVFPVTKHQKLLEAIYCRKSWIEDIDTVESKISELNHELQRKQRELREVREMYHYCEVEIDNMFKIKRN